jgi:hypothetical protein
MFDRVSVIFQFALGMQRGVSVSGGVVGYCVKLYNGLLVEFFFGF